MTSSDPHGDRELAIFHGFSEKCALGIDAASIEKRDPPEPDILCRTVSGESIAFELVEALDSDLARGVYGKLRLEKNFRDAFAALRQAHKDSLSAHVGDALLYVCYDRSLSLSRRCSLIPAVFDEVRRIDSGFVGTHTPGGDSPVHGVVRQILVNRGSYTGPIFDVEAFAWYEDPVVDALETKFGKSYETDAPIELLVFYEIQPSDGRVEISEVVDFVREHVGSSPFRRVWIHEVSGVRPPVSVSEV